MSKRSSLGGDSPIQKTLKTTSSQKSDDINLSSGHLSESHSSDPPDFYFGDGISSSPLTQRSQSVSWSLPQSLGQGSPDCPDLSGYHPPSSVLRSLSSSSSSSGEERPGIRTAPTHETFQEALTEYIAMNGVDAAAKTILENTDLKNEIIKNICRESHDSLKSKLKDSKLCADKKSRNFLLTLTPSSLCQEFQSQSPPAFLLLVQGLLGISDPDTIFESQHLLNNVCFLYSTISKTMNRKATGYALLMTTTARDGGLREDSIKTFSMFVHPRTSQKYDREVLSKGWDKPLEETLVAEKEHFVKLHEALRKKIVIDVDENIDEVDDEIEELLNTIPPQVQQVWDNLNLRTKHRFERGDDDYAKNNFDWMASILIKDRINVNHMDGGAPLKAPHELLIEDFVPSDTEKDYAFQSLVYYYAHRLVERYPLAFKSIKSSIKPNKPHQFKTEMDEKSEEFTGNLYTKSESNTEDLIGMMADIQKQYVHTFEDDDGTIRCYERKILSGDNKTEKNQTNGIYSKLDEQTQEDRLEFLLPQHEYFHQNMVVADCESELFRDNSRGLEGGAFFVTTLLNRKEARTAKGKNAIDSFKDIFMLKSDARFIQYFMIKNNFDSSEDNTPPLLKTKNPEEKQGFLHNLVAECLRDLLPYFQQSKLSDETHELLVDHPLQQGRREIRRQNMIKNSAEHVAPEALAMPSQVTYDLAVATADVVDDRLKDEFVLQYLETKSVQVSASRSKTLYVCKICSQESKYRAVCIAHIENCLIEPEKDAEDCSHDDESSEVIALEESLEESVSSIDSGCKEAKEEEEDFFFNYKNGEFFLDSLFMLSTTYERYGDGLGCFILSKMMLPIFHGLHHSNYSCSVHRFINRVLAEASPREALKIIHERFSNRVGKPGKNVFRDRRMEFRIGVTKKLIENLGPNFNEQSVKQVNQMVDVKEDLYLHTRISHGVHLRSGRHVPRSDEADFNRLVTNLTKLEAHVKKPGRKFGELKVPRNVMDDLRFDKTRFYRWIAKKNDEAGGVLEAKKKV